MLSKEQSENLLYSLPSFYRDFLPVDNSLLKLYDVYAKTIDYAWNVYRETEDGQFISTTRTVSTIPYFKVDIEDAFYSVQTAEILSGMNFEDQVAYMDKNNLYASFSFSQKNQTDDPIVYSMRLMISFTDTVPLKMFTDYFIRNNRLYLLPSFVQSNKQVLRYLHAFDMKINDYTLEKNFGSRFQLKPGSLLTRFEYRDVLEAYIRAFQGNLTIRALKESIRLATKWDTFSIEDMKSPSISEAKLQLYKDWTISPLKFLVTLPEELIPEKAKTNIVRTLLNEIKESQTDYMLFYDVLRLDEMPIMMKKKPIYHVNRTDPIRNKETSKVSKLTLKVHDNPFDLFGTYDTTFFYNQTLDYDAEPKPEIVGIQQHSANWDETQGDDQVAVKFYSLMIPRNFHANKDLSAETITFSVNSNQDTTTSFELYGALRIDGTYRLIESVANNKQQGTISFLHNAIGSGNLYYKSRSKDLSKVSLFTLPIYIGDQSMIPMFDEDDIIHEDYLLEEAYVVDTSLGMQSLIAYLLDITAY
jgi:hypothetical protein